MKNSNKTAPQSRRRFLKHAAVAGGAASALALAKGSEAAAVDGPRTSVDGDQKGYQETEHVALYYRSARI